MSIVEDEMTESILIRLIVIRRLYETDDSFHAKSLLEFLILFICLC